MSRKRYSIFRRTSKATGKAQGPWYVAWTDGTGRRRTKMASDNRNIAHEIGRSLAAEADRVRSGMVQARDLKVSRAGRRPVDEHVDAWEKALLDKGDTAEHATRQARHVRRLLNLSECNRLDDLAGEKIQSALAAISEDSSPNNARHYLGAIRTFVKWCGRTDRLSVDPLLSVVPPKTLGKTFRRQPIDALQLAGIMEAARTRKGWCRIKGPDRAMMYLVMAYTGFRLSETVSLTPESFDLTSQRPGVTVEAGYSKRRRRDTIPLRADVVAKLRPWLAGKPAGKKLFAEPSPSRWFEVFKRDCAAAGIVEKEGHVLGVHSLRRFFITQVVRAGGLAVGQELARHSTPVLTKEYTDLTYADHDKGLAGLPPVPQTPPAQQTETPLPRRKHA